MPKRTDARLRAYLLLAVMPAFFSTNIVFGRGAIDEVEPFTLAFLRWFLAGSILALALRGPFAGLALRRLALPLLGMGFLGMWVCGALVYVALKYTSATNGTLIYTSSPVLIIALEWALRGRAVGWREIAGIVLAVSGVVVIVCRGDVQTLLGLQFNRGDLIFVATAVSWALYSVWLKSERFAGIDTFALFAAIALAGAVLLAPFAAFEIGVTQSFPHTARAWTWIGGIVALSSLVAFSCFSYGVSVLGSSVAGVFLYLLPVYGVALAVLLLGEQLRPFHFTGIACVLGGVVLATLPARISRGAANRETSPEG